MKHSSYRWLKRLVLISLITWPVAGFAANVLETARQFFSDFGTGYGAASYDMSTYMLGQIFGNVSTLLFSPTETLVPLMIKYFNLGVMIFAGSVISVTSTMTVINTSARGSLMSPNMRFTPFALRSIISIGILAPTVNGYSFLQAFVIWAVLQGVGVANGVWNVVQQTLNSTGGGIVTTLSDDNQDVLTSRAQSIVGDSLSSTSSWITSSQTDLQKSQDLALTFYLSQLCFYQNKDKIPGASFEINSPTVDQSQQFVRYNYPQSERRALRDSRSFYDCQTSINFYQNISDVIAPFKASPTTQMSQTWWNNQFVMPDNNYDRTFNQLRYSQLFLLFSKMDLLAQDTWAAVKATRAQVTAEQLAPLYTCLGSAPIATCEFAKRITDAAADYVVGQKQVLYDLLLRLQKKQSDDPSAKALGQGGWITSGFYYSTLARGYFSGNVGLSQLKQSVKDFDLTGLMGVTATVSLKTPNPSYQGNYRLLFDAAGLKNAGENTIKNALSRYRSYLTEAKTKTVQQAVDAGDKLGPWIQMKRQVMRAAQVFSSTDTYVCQNKNFLGIGGKTCQRASVVNTDTKTESFEHDWFKVGNQAVEDQKNRKWNIWTAMGCSGLLNFQIVGYNYILGMIPIQGIIGGSKGSICDRSDLVQTMPSSFSAVSKIFEWYGTDFIETYLQSGISQWINNDVQVFLYQLMSAWINNFMTRSGQETAPDSIVNEDGTTSDPTLLASGFVQANPIDQLLHFGVDIITATLNFLTNIITDVWATNLSAMYYFQGLTFAAMFGAQMAGMAGGLMTTFAPFVKSIPFVGPALYGIFKIGGSILVGVGSALANAAQAIPLNYYLVLAKLFLYTPIAVAATIPVIILGLIALCYVPLVPFFTFIFTVIGWFISVIEAVLAMPLVAFGMTSPTGHQFLGKAEQAMMLLLSVMVRPVLILFGFLFAIMLVYLGVYLTSQMVVTIITSYMQAGGLAGLGGDASNYVNFSQYGVVLMMLFMYCYMIIGVVEFCMTLIYRLPNYVLRWIGVPVREYGEMNRMRELKNTFVQQMQGLGQSAGQTFQSVKGDASPKGGG